MSSTAQQHRYIPTAPTIPNAQLSLPEAAETLRMVSSAIAENRLRIAYQPVASAIRPEAVAFYECLVRIIDHAGEIIPAARFIADIEAQDIGRIVDRQVLRMALETLATTRRVRLSVNLSACGVGDQGWLDILKAAEAATPGICDFLIVEITESAVMSLTPRDLEFLYELRALGCSIALDDFGAGHTSIGHLGKFRFDFIKIDGSFVRDIADNKDNQFLVRSMISIARHFEMVSVAEMVSSAKDIAILRGLGIDCVQGYHIGMPDFEPGWISNQSAASA